MILITAETASFQWKPIRFCPDNGCLTKDYDWTFRPYSFSKSSLKFLLKPIFKTQFPLRSFSIWTEFFWGRLTYICHMIKNNIWQLEPVLVLMVWKIKRKPRKCGEFQVLQLLLSLTLRISLERHATDIRLLTGLLLSHFWLLACNFTKSNTPPWMFFTFFKLCKWFQITQRITKYVFIEVRHE